MALIFWHGEPFDPTAKAAVPRALTAFRLVAKLHQLTRFHALLIQVILKKSSIEQQHEDHSNVINHRQQVFVLHKLAMPTENAAIC
jgi:hypothetical protein